MFDFNACLAKIKEILDLLDRSKPLQGLIGLALIAYLATRM